MESAPVSITQVGSYFVQQYYQVLQQQPDDVHRFYTEDSSMARVDGDSTESASGMPQIHALITSLNFIGIEVKTIISQKSWSEGVVVGVSGSVKFKEFSGWRKFVQNFLLAPQEKGYFVLNDMFYFVTDEVVHHHTTPAILENELDSPPTSSSHLLDPPVSDYTLEVEARDYVNSVHIEGDEPVDEYSFQEHQLQQEPEAETVEETPVEEASGSLQNEVENVQNEVEIVQNKTEAVQEPQPAIEESIGEPPKLTYASILRAPKGKFVTSIATQAAKSTPLASDWHHPPTAAVQQSNFVLPSVGDSSVEVAEEGLSQEGESKSVYVRNLPSTVSTLDILHELKNFGRIKHDGVFLRNRKEIGVCYAFVEFEDVQSAQSAIKASPVQLAGRQVYIEERKANSSSSTRGGRSGRGRGYQNEALRGRSGARTFGRGSNQDGSDYNRQR